MTISATGRRYAYSANGVTTAFSYPRPFFSGVDLTVYLFDAGTDVATLKVLASDYTVTGAGDPAGGFVNFLTPPASGLTVIIYSALDATQPLDLDNVTALPMTSLESELDRLTILIQDMWVRLDRMPQAPLSKQRTFNYTLPIPVPGWNLGANASGTGFEYLPPGSGGGGGGPTTPVFVSSRAQLAALSTTMMAAVLTESGRSGVFLQVAGTQPVSDPMQALYVASNSPGYYWERQRPKGELQLSWAGAAIDGVTDDLAAINACMALLNDASGVVSSFRWGTGTIGLSGNPDPLTRSNTSITGSGGGSTTLKKLASATDKGGFVTIGVSSQITHVTLRGFTCDCTANYTTITTDHAIWFRYCLDVTVDDVGYVFVPQMWRFGEAGTARDAQHVMISNIYGQLRPNNGNVCIVGYNYSNIQASGGFLGVTGTTRPNARIIGIYSDAAGTGCDSLVFSNMTMNGQFLESDYAYEFDYSYNGISNVQLANNVLDGGTIATILIKCAAGQDAANTHRLIGFGLTGNRVSSKIGSGGGNIRVMQDSDNALISFEVVGNIFNADDGRVYYHTAGVAIPITSFSATFGDNVYSDNGNSVNRPVFETAVGGLTITGGRVQTGSEGTSAKFTNLVKLTGSAARVNVHGVDCAALSGATVLDATALTAANVNLTQIGGCSGKPHGAIRYVQTVAAGTVTLAQTSALPDGKYFWTGRVMVEKSDHTTWDAFTYRAAISVVSGVASVVGSPTITNEAASGYAVSIDTTSNMARVRCGTGAVITANWFLVQYNLESAQ